MEDMKKEKISLSELFPTITAMLETGGEFLFYPDGESMLPTIRSGRDGVVLCRAEEIKRGDLLLYRRGDGSFVLHRLVKIRKNGSFIMRGDNQYINEYGIKKDNVVGKVCAIMRGKKRISTFSLSFRAKSSLRLFFYPAKKLFFRARRKLKKIAGRKR